jgi:predicted phage baseplate assembly protein
LLPADKPDAEVSEAAVLDTVTPANAGQTALTFGHALGRIYDRATVRLNANVVGGTHGETVQEILGSADASQPNQSFTLKQSPLTYLSAPSGQGAASTLQVWVNDLRWHEQPSLLDAAARDRVFAIRAQPGGAVTVQFGDGRQGARPPTGQTNVRAVYRKGLGFSGMVAPGQLSNAIDRPPGLKSVMNPAAATGGADADTPADARRSAPLHVLTLERVVSLQDYQDFSTAFAGIARALATWTWSGSARGVVVTVAGPVGAALDPDGETIANLAAALRGSGNRYVPVTVLPYQAKRFEIAGLVRVDTDNYDPVLVLAAVRAALLAAFGFDARALGQGVAQSEVIAAIQAVPGVQGTRINRFSRADVLSVLPDNLPAAAPQAGARGVVAGAELLLIDPLSLASVEQWP